MQRYFIKNDDFNKNIITGTDVFHISKVIRCAIGDEIIVCNEDGKCSFCSIESIDSFISFKSLSGVISNELDIAVTIAQCLPKGDKMDYIVQKSTELGIKNIIPIKSERVVVKYDSKKENKKIDRWNKIAKEASEQSHRNYIPKILDFNTISKIDLNYDALIVCYEDDNTNISTFKETLKNDIKSILVLIGPEGGLTSSEIDELVSKGFKTCGLGKRILRTETASSFVMSSIIYEKELK